MHKSRGKTIDLGNFGFSYCHVPSLDSFSPENCTYFSLLIESMLSSRLVEMQFVVWNVFHGARIYFNMEETNKTVSDIVMATWKFLTSDGRQSLGEIFVWFTVQVWVDLWKQIIRSQRV